MKNLKGPLVFNQCRWSLNVLLVFKQGRMPIKARDTSASGRFSRSVPRRFGSGPSKWYIPGIYLSYTICLNSVFKTSVFSSLFTLRSSCSVLQQCLLSRHCQTGSLGATVTTSYLCTSCDSEINEIWQIYIRYIPDIYHFCLVYVWYMPDIYQG